MISTAVQKSSNRVEVYDEKGSYKFSLSGELVGFTGTTVSVRKSGNRIEVYNDKGSYQFSK
ncbi:MAG: hypothetical protein IKW86_08450 [Salinivirgaceae bacterium]|nr:hypothetical protein [Salinivirgaceae bacterium]